MPCRCRRLRRRPAVSIEDEGAVAALEHGVDRVAGRAGDLARRSARSRPRSALTRLDLPTFGRPRIATRIASSGSDGRPAGASRSSSSTIAVEQVAGAVPCRPEIGIGSPSPSRWNSSANGSWLGSSILFASTSTGLCASRRIWATSSSPGVTPARASTTKSTRSASPIASRACSAIARVSGVGSAMSTPPVSTSTKRLPVHSQTSSLRSRVTPGVSCTTAARVSVSRLTSVDLPTFGKPTIATVPRSGGGGGAGNSPASGCSGSLTPAA